MALPLALSPFARARVLVRRSDSPVPFLSFSRAGNRNQQDDVHMQETMPLSGGHSSGYNPEQDIVVVGQFEQDVGAEYGETI